MKRPQLMVRLSKGERRGIIRAVNRVTRGKHIECEMISLFGSRTQPNQRGGDIDLYIRLSTRNVKNADLATLKRALRLAIQDEIGDQKIDLILDDGFVQLGAIGDVIQQEKVNLWTKDKPNS